jgi:hypothetical protein
VFGAGMSPVELLLRCHVTSAFAVRQKVKIKSRIIAMPDTFLLKNVHPASTMVFLVCPFIDKLL